VFYGTSIFITVFTTARHCPYLKPDESSPRPIIPFLGDTF